MFDVTKVTSLTPQIFLFVICCDSSGQYHIQSHSLSTPIEFLQVLPHNLLTLERLTDSMELVLVAL